MVAKAVDYLKSKGQKPDGSFTAEAGPAVTALVAAGLLRNGRTADDPVVAKALKYVEGFVQPDGAICAPNSLYKNYETCLGVLAFSEANKNGKYDKTLKGADAFLKGLQWDESEQKEKSDTFYGGAGYGNSKRPDLSNTNFLIDALKATGNGADSEAIQRALVFVSRCQNLETAHNTTPFAAKNPDGGFYYTPAAGGQSQAGPTPEGGLRSYGSMTYAGLKSMIYAGVKPDDPRVQAAIKWLAKNYDLSQNPGMADAGLFYYYHTLAKALDALGQPTFKDEKGVAHDWRQELLAELKERQNEDGSWTNKNARWREGDANLVTGYVLLTLAHCHEKPAAAK
jgi:squalene-hopene/tetraprenyl-beta-curcumene cyclase